MNAASVTAGGPGLFSFIQIVVSLMNDDRLSPATFVFSAMHKRGHRQMREKMAMYEDSAGNASDSGDSSSMLTIAVHLHLRIRDF